MGFSEELRRKTEPIWEKILSHPFVLGIGRGDLPVEKFKFYVRQDYVFLIEYSRFLALAAAKAHDLPTMGKLAELLHATLNTEMALHRSYCAKFGITEKELESTAPAPTTQAYTRHLLYIAHAGSIGEIAAALLPCQWGYREIGQKLAAKGEPPQPLYAEWVRMYASAEYAGLAGWFLGLVDRLAEGAGKDELARMEANYMASARYEYMFWDMAYRMEQWAI